MEFASTFCCLLLPCLGLLNERPALTVDVDVASFDKPHNLTDSPKHTQKGHSSNIDITESSSMHCLNDSLDLDFHTLRCCDKDSPLLCLSSISKISLIYQ